MLSNLKKNYLLLIYTFLLLYFFFNLLGGERGLISYFEKKKIQKQLIEEKKSMIVKLNTVEKKNKLLTENIDLDYLEIIFRDKFMYGKKSEKIYLTN